MAMEKIASFLRKDTTGPTLSYYLLFICLGLDLGLLGPNLTALAEQTNVTLGMLGSVFLLGALGGVIGTLIAGRVFDRVLGHPILGSAALVIALFTLCIPLIPSLWLLLALLFLKGIAGGMIGAGANTLLVWTHREKVSPYMNGLHFSFGLGAFLAPFLVAQVAGGAGGYRLAFWIIAALDALAALRLFTLAKSPAPVPARAESTEGGSAPASQVPLIVTAALFLFFYVGAEISFGGWIASYAVTLRLADVVGAAYLTSGFWLSFTIGRLISIPAATRFTPRQIIPAALVGCMAILALPLALPGSFAALWATAVVLGFCMAPIWPMGFTLAGQSLHMTARTTSFVLLGDTFGGMMLPWLMGLVLDRTGPAAVMALVLVSLAATTVAFVGIVRLRAAGKT
jgi:FHS family Na+ dependent glucose MFS transporter 1